MTTPFVEWNSLLLEELFSPASRDEEVWVHATRQELDSFGLHLGGAEGLITATRRGPPWIDARGHCADIVARLVRQRTANVRAAGYVDPGLVLPEYHGARAPTYLPYLAVWVLASSEAEDGFYKQVDALLANGAPWKPHHSEAMFDAWSDLERWSTNDAKGQFGSFRVRVLGEHRFVGIPKSQCLMSQRDHENIARLFHGAALRPGQNLTDALFQRLVAQGADAHYLSAGLRGAMNKRAFHEPLRRMLADHLVAWDGRVPRSAPEPGARPSADDSPHHPELEATVSLIPSSSWGTEWELRWRIPALVDSGAIELKRGEVTWKAWIESLGTHATSDGREQEAIGKALQDSSVSDVVLWATYFDAADDNGGLARQVALRVRHLRILAWDSPDPATSAELVERELPIAGPVYLLCAPGFHAQLESYLSREGIVREACATSGLPAGWQLVCVLHCERLTWEQRDWLSDGTAGAPAVARIRLTGGRPIIRGGSRRYAYYDLPLVELEAPSGTELAADGLELQRIELGSTANARPAIDRFRIHKVDQSRASFELIAGKGGEVIARSRLRITAAGGTAVTDGWDFSVDALGRPMRNNDGLRGVLPLSTHTGTDRLCPDELALVQLEALGKEVDPSGCTAGIESQVAALFLDTLAQLGSMSYGAARDQLVRLSRTGQGFFPPVLALLELRNRGQLELETDSKGHLARVHAVPPTLYSLPAAHDGLAIFGVCGTLRLQQWNDLCRQADGVAYVERRNDIILPVLRLLCTGEEDAARVAQRVGIGYASEPCLRVALWAGSIEMARAELVGFGWETLARHVRGLQRLHPESAEFRSAQDQSLMSVDPILGCALFRFEDPDIAGHQAYVLGAASGGSSPRYSYVHDSRWGVWLATSAFAEMARTRFHICDASPWPFPYDGASRMLWLPARLRPPFAIERALALCSGSPPLAIKTKGEPENGRLTLRSDLDGRFLGSASMVYSSMASGVWLAYPWVPRRVGEVVAEHLGGSLQDF